MELSNSIFNSNDILEGLIFSDGNLDLPNKNGNARYQQTSSKKGFLEWSAKYLPSTFTITGPHRVKRKYHYYLLRTPCLPLYTSIYHRWYVNNNKRIPKDFKLKRATLLAIYLSDGCLENRNFSLYNKTPNVHLGTYSLTDSDRRKFVFMLEEYGFNISIKKRGDIRIKSRDLKKFFDFIGPCPRELLNVYGYKFPFIQIV